MTARPSDSVPEGPAATDDASPAAGPYLVLGRTIALPVEVRRAAQWGVQYLVPAAAAQRLVDPTGQFYRFNLAGSLLKAAVPAWKKEKA